MAQVWLATDQVLERQVAVKILHPHLASDESFVARFRAEAVAAARLRHPSIVSIYDTCSGDGVQAIVMELVRGQNLRQRLNDAGSLTAPAVVNIGAQVADALAAAHRAGLVHRDIKPANILLCEDNRVMVTDFGIAKVRGDPDLTQTGLMLGSVKYLSPEQVNGGDVDGRTDIYALAVVLYEALCGRPPFAADTDAATALQRLHNEPLRPRQIKAGIPRGLEDVIMRGMARDPDARYATAEEFRAALLAANRGEVVEPRPGADATQMVAAPRPRPASRPPANRSTGARRPAPPPKRRPPARQQPQSFAQSERGWLVPMLVIVLIALSLVTAGVLIGRTEAGQDLFDRARGAVESDEQGAADPPAEGSTADAVTIASVSSFDPQGSGTPGENDSDVPLAWDGDASTAWTTEGYNNRNLAPKDGVGLVVELAEPADLGELALTSSTQDWSASIYVADAPAGSLDGWGEPVATSSGIGGDASFDLDGATGGAVLIWITDLGERPPGDDKFRANIAGISLSPA
jgi:serine/threonine-protein kinase